MQRARNAEGEPANESPLNNPDSAYAADQHVTAMLEAAGGAREVSMAADRQDFGLRAYIALTASLPKLPNTLKRRENISFASLIAVYMP
jgi:hypothetical protein